MRSGNTALERKSATEDSVTMANSATTAAHAANTTAAHAANHVTRVHISSGLGRFVPYCLAALIGPLGCGGAPTAALEKSTVLGTRIDRVDVGRIPVKGHRVSITYGRNGCIIEGELVAVTREDLVVLDEIDTLLQVRISELVAVELELYPSMSGSLYTTTTVGSVSTLSHGYWLVLSLPVWLAVGLPLASSESSASRLAAPPSDTPKLAAYARFPQGAFMNWTDQAHPVVRCD